MPAIDDTPLPDPPSHLTSGEVTLHFSHIIPGDPARDFVPSYHFRITVAGLDIGHISLRIGDTEHVRQSAGHIGFEIAAPHRGHRFALQACRALSPFAASFRRPFLLTCDPDNPASRRTIELLGATFIDEVPVPPNDPHYARGSRTKLRFQWNSECA